MRRILLIGLAALVLLAACGGGDDEQSLDGTTWVLETIDDGDASTPVLPDTEPTLVFDGTSVSGSDGCNNLSGTVTVGPDDAISFGQMAGTLMACPEPIMDQAAIINETLAAAETYEINDTTLMLSSEDRQLIYSAG
jgi:heat shock protein HslJ